MSGEIGLFQIQQFLLKEQNRELPLAEIKSICEKFSSCADKTYLNLEDFEAALTSEMNTAFEPSKIYNYQDMTHPMSHYWISSSHNTYLVGDQLKSESSTEMYITALREGYRCLEIDIWDGVTGEPIVYHGRTLTSKILFKDVIQVIAQHAFTCNPYPVILSLENHCSIPQQQKMAKYMRELFGDLLQLPLNPSKYPQMPSPEDLKCKILLKGSVEDISPEEEEEEENDKNDKNDKNEKGEKRAFKIAPELTEIIFFRSQKFDANRPKEEMNPFAMSSFNESKANSFSAKQNSFFINYNVNQMSRICKPPLISITSLFPLLTPPTQTPSPVFNLLLSDFSLLLSLNKKDPAGTRFDSSNYDPMPMWNAGCQMVALNIQTKKIPIWLNQAKFSENGSTGWLLKPEYMRNLDTPPTPGRISKLKVTVIDANLLDNSFFPILNPLVTLQILGHAEDQKVFETTPNSFVLPLFHPFLFKSFFVVKREQCTQAGMERNFRVSS